MRIIYPQKYFMLPLLKMNYFAFVEEDVMFLATENDLAGIIEKMSFRLSIFDIIYSLNKCQL